MTIDKLHAAIRELPAHERLRLVERIIHDIVESSHTDVQPSSVISMMADDAELMDEVCAGSTADRERRPR